jgi:hypothetical protein
VRALAPSAETITALHHFHPLAEIDLPLFVNDFHPEMNLVLDKKTFISILTRSPCLSFNIHLRMVYELL